MRVIHKYERPSKTSVELKIIDLVQDHHLSMASCKRFGVANVGFRGWIAILMMTNFLCVLEIFLIIRNFIRLFSPGSMGHESRFWFELDLVTILPDSVVS